jgi:four helix bundle protein
MTAHPGRLVRYEMQDTKNLIVADHARKVALEVYRVTTAFPPSERDGLTSQMRRAAVSIGSNIAEGCGRRGVRDLVGYLYIAMGSASELEFQTELAKELKLVAPPAADSLLAAIQRLKRMLAKLIAALRTQPAARRKEGPA